MPRTTKGNTRTPKTASAPTAPSKPTCLCGCGQTPNGRRSEFVPGHDARLKQALIVSALGGDKAAEQRLVERGWTHFLVSARERAEKKAATSKAKADKKKAAKATTAA